ncbi:hypothetical protein PDESU_01704 [Pontiella desulfatans]|uniref:PEP-CTERM protein-sorting domain-containing protein n=2 Tax=Pontiella desulfatans TaxID=2750659 RepID=A0A6C2TZM0_PONDE|nr:hypothetical protein PDESU_01704 [Pontiella desulfatans]
MTLAGVLLAGAAQAGISLDLPSAGNYTNSTTVSTAVVDASGATFDIVYTVTADDLHGSTPTDWLQVSVNSMGVNDGTIYGTYNEWMSFTSLSIENFNAGGSGLAADDIAELTFSAITLTSVGHSNDGMDLFFSGDKSGTANNVNLSGYVANTIQTIDISGFGSGTALSIEADTYQDTNKFGVGGLEVSYAVIPEPAALGMIMVSGAGMLFVRRWFML